jgi:recombination protein RecA
MSTELVESILREVKNNPIMRSESMKGVKPVVYSEFEGIDDKEVVPTGFAELDYVLLGGAGGFPLGRIVEIYGLESSGKSTIAIRTIAEAQKLGHVCALIDTELTYSDGHAKEWLIKQGVEPEKLIYVREPIAERVMASAQALMETGKVRVVVIDSIAASLAKDQSIKAKIESTQKGSYEDRTVGSRARVWTEGLTNLNTYVVENKVLLICTNQVRQKISGYNPSGAVVYQTPGGQAAKHLYSIRLKVDRVKPIVENGKQVGIWSKCQVKKNKVTHTDGWETMKQTLTHLPIYYDGRKVDAFESLLPVAIEKGIILRKGPRTYVYGDIEATSRDKFIEALKEADVLEELKQKISQDVYANTVDYVVEGDD